MIKTLDDFVKKYDTIRNKWIVTHRNGSTGVGKTLEDLLEIKENNIDGPDYQYRMILEIMNLSLAELNPIQC